MPAQAALHLSLPYPTSTSNLLFLNCTSLATVLLEFAETNSYQALSDNLRLSLAGKVHECECIVLSDLCFVPYGAFLVISGFSALLWKRYPCKYTFFLCKNNQIPRREMKIVDLLRWDHFIFDLGKKKNFFNQIQLRE